MEPAGPFSKLLRRPPKRLLDDYDPELDAPIRGLLFPRPIFRALVAVFGGFVMLTVDWFGLLLLNMEGVRLSIGLLNALRVTAVLMTGIAVTSALLMVHYRRIYSYISDENIFFAITFSISFMLGAPCVLVGLFG
jgi:ABC-type phosphate transport system permease subunit